MTTTSPFRYCPLIKDDCKGPDCVSYMGWEDGDGIPTCIIFSDHTHGRHWGYVLKCNPPARVISEEERREKLAQDKAEFWRYVAREDAIMGR